MPDEPTALTQQPTTRQMPSSRWHWPQSDHPLDMSALIVCEWKHSGDSPMRAARPRKRPGHPMPPPSFLLKCGRDAIGERLYALVARHFDLPSAVVHWTTCADLPEVAIRFESAAWRPERIDPQHGIATADEQDVQLQNPSDYYRHLALGAFLDDYDGAEFLVCRDLLVRIDAAACGWSLFSSFLSNLFRPGGVGDTAPPVALSSLVRTTADGLQQETTQGYHLFLETLAEIVAWAELPTSLADDLRACPTAPCRLLPPDVEQFLHRAPPTLSELADAIELYLRQQQQALTLLLSESHVGE